MRCVLCTSRAIPRIGQDLFRLSICEMFHGHGLDALACLLKQQKHHLQGPFIPKGIFLAGAVHLSQLMLYPYWMHYKREGGKQDLILLQETGHTVQGTGVQGTGVQGTGVQDTDLQDTGVQGTGVQGTGVQDTDLQDTGVQGTGVQGTTFSAFHIESGEAFCCVSTLTAHN